MIISPVLTTRLQLLRLPPRVQCKLKVTWGWIKKSYISCIELYVIVYLFYDELVNVAKTSILVMTDP